MEAWTYQFEMVSELLKLCRHGITLAQIHVDEAVNIVHHPCPCLRAGHSLDGVSLGLVVLDQRLGEDHVAAILGHVAVAALDVHASGITHARGVVRDLVYVDHGVYKQVDNHLDGVHQPKHEAETQQQ